LKKDEGTDAVIIVGEVGGEQEEKAAGFIARQMTKPVACYIAGRYSPPGKRMGHAGAIVRGTSGTVEGKESALRAAGVTVLDSPKGSRRPGQSITSFPDAEFDPRLRHHKKSRGWRTRQPLDY